eukprot:714953-Hanusia_phi.AAC.3
MILKRRPMHVNESQEGLQRNRWRQAVQPPPPPLPIFLLPPPPPPLPPPISPSSPSPYLSPPPPPPAVSSPRACECATTKADARNRLADHMILRTSEARSKEGEKGARKPRKKGGE